jgi:hypothetical protein
VVQGEKISEVVVIVRKYEDLQIAESGENLC